MSLVSGPGVSNAAVFLVLATDGLSEGERDIFLREVIAYGADGLRELHGPVLAAETIYMLGDQLIARGVSG